MKKIFQTVKWDNEVNANCFQAVTASYLEMNLDEVPNFCANRNRYWIEDFKEFIDSTKKYVSRGFEYTPPPLDGKFHIAYEWVNEKHGHAVIVKDGKVVHDPMGRIMLNYNIVGYFPIEKTSYEKDQRKKEKSTCFSK